MASFHATYTHDPQAHIFFLSTSLSLYFSLFILSYQMYQYTPYLTKNDGTFWAHVISQTLSMMISLFHLIN